MVVARVISSFLYGAPFFYPWIVTVVSLASLSVAAIALVLPAYRVAWVDPLSALREE
jgi:ABC-type lipoprotein release transport system permease subunit